MDDDLDFDFPKRSQNSVSKGRRAKPGGNLDETSENGSNAPTSQPRNSTDNFAADGPKRMVGGWGDEEILSTPPLTGSKSRSGRKRGEDMDFTTSTGFSTFDDDNDSDPDIPVIPELEDSGGDDVGVGQIAMAPSVAVNKVTSYKELDSDLQRSSQFSMLDGSIDLKLLSKCLVAQDETKNDDKLWDWDHLFTEVSSELQADLDSKDAYQQQGPVADIIAV